MSSCDFSRRDFLKAVGAMGGAALLEGVFTRVALAATAGASDKMLVVVFLRGGMDALNAVVPAFEPAYFTSRPTIAVPASRLLALDGTFGLHPSLSALQSLYKSGSLAIVHACGNPDPSRSHFSAQRSVENASYQATAQTSGWLDRYVAGTSATGQTMFAGLSFSATMPVSLQGPVAALSMTSLDSFKLSAYPDESSRYQAALWALYGSAPAPFSAATMTLGAFTDAAAAAAKPLSSVTYPSSSLGTSLRDVARLARAGVGLRAVSVDVNDWDMHVDIGKVDGGDLSKKFSDLGGSLAAFVTDLGSLYDKTTIVVMSEFGRRVAENGGGGADHGHGGCMFVLGGGLRGGKIYTRWPGLGAAALDNGDLAITTDYRDVLTEILSGRLGANASSVFPGYVASPVGLA